MHEYDLKELLKDNKIVLMCYRCKVKIVDIAGISGLIVMDDMITALCQNVICRNVVVENCVKVLIE